MVNNYYAVAMNSNLPDSAIREIIFELQELDNDGLDKIARESGGLTIAYRQAREQKDNITGQTTPESLDERIFSLTSLLAREFMVSRNDDTDFDPFEFCGISEKPPTP